MIPIFPLEAELCPDATHFPIYDVLPFDFLLCYSISDLIFFQLHRPSTNPILLNAAGTRHQQSSELIRRHVTWSEGVLSE